MFPPFGLSEKVPLFRGIISCYLAIERSQRTIMRGVFHSDLPGLDTQTYSLSMRQSHYRYTSELNLDCQQQPDLPATQVRSRGPRPATNVIEKRNDKQNSEEHKVTE